MKGSAMVALAACALALASICATASAHSSADGFLDASSAGRQLLQKGSDDSSKKNDDDKLKCTNSTVSVPVAAYAPVAFPAPHWNCTVDKNKTTWGCVLLPPIAGNGTLAPTVAPTAAPTACCPCSTTAPTAAPTTNGTLAPTAAPSANGTLAPTAAPTANGTKAPTAAPTADGTKAPTAAPTANGTKVPTAAPTADRTKAPTAAPTANGTKAPAATSTAAPAGAGGDTKTPTATPTTTPTAAPTPRKPQPPKCYSTKKGQCCDANKSEVGTKYSRKDGFKCEKNGRFKFRCCRPYEKVCFNKNFRQGKRSVKRECCYDRSRKLTRRRGYRCFQDSHEGYKGFYCYRE